MTDDTTAQQPATAAGDGDVEQRPGGGGIGRALLWRALVGVTALTLTVSASAWLLHAGIDPQADPWSVLPPRNATLEAVRSWALESSNRTVTEDADLVVVEGWRIATGAGDLRRDRIASLKRRRDGSERLALARLSLTQMCEDEPRWRAEWAAAQIVTGTTSDRVGITPALERHAAAARPLASSDRTWRVRTTSAPTWLGSENPAKPGCWNVNFNDAAWLEHLAGGEGAVIDQLISDGIDGVLLDVGTGAADRLGRLQLRELIARVARRTRDQQRGFIVALGIGGENLADRRLLRVIDALAAAPLPDEASNQPYAAELYRQRVRQLAQARVDGVMVMIAAGPEGTPPVGAERNRIDQLGFVRQVSARGGAASTR